MKKRVLISCVSKKLDRPARSKDLYTSTLFKLSYRYATSLKPDTIFILSAKYGLLSCDDVVAPYDITLNEMNAGDVKKWSERVLAELRKRTDLQKDLFVFLAGQKYRKYLLPHVNNLEIPMEGLGIGKQLSWLKQRVSNKDLCAEIHALFQKAERYSFPFDVEVIPRNGIYVLFEKGEDGHGSDRIVRVGSHTGEGQLCSRLQQHFINEDKDRSIFRKNIGRAILNRGNDPFLEQWEWDLTPRKNREKYSAHLDFARQEQVEKQVSDYIQRCFSFAVFEVSDKKRRLELESRLISTVSLCSSCGPSDTWLGLYSPKEKIRESGLWLVNHLYRSPLREGDYGFICRMLRSS